MNPSFSPKEICAIIKQCKESGVLEFSFGHLCVKFGGHTESTPGWGVVPFTEQRASIVESQAREQLVKDEVLVKEDKLDLMLIEDPIEYERLRELGDLTDDRTAEEAGS